MAAIGIMFYIEIFGFFGVIWLMANMQRRGKLTEQFFAIMSLSYISLFVLTAFLLAPPKYEFFLIWAVITMIFWILGYPSARWLYRQLFPPK